MENNKRYWSRKAKEREPSHTGTVVSVKGEWVEMLCDACGEIHTYHKDYLDPQEETEK